MKTKRRKQPNKASGKRRFQEEQLLQAVCPDYYRIECGAGACVDGVSFVEATSEAHAAEQFYEEGWRHAVYGECEGQICPFCLDYLKDDEEMRPKVL